ncbi:hypothetical protein P1P75_33195 [Streptomyces sp. ID05-39B]|uniref:hypothetical protein n=1 Tax=Streptomyces sp. ID05-39B TaxID=3028664 RepID=UPI0029B6EC91|nr:hypothetical protein [Streptomyces sp. ID05-39B]MDX3531134.1 hypothetical protein [Streptomyces sp. ID05-39B]
MTPPNPKRSRRLQTLRYDPTFGDRPLAQTLQDLLIGRWQGPRDLLKATGTDWDRRTHRIRILAETAATCRISETWQIAEPHNADALALRADTEVMRLFFALSQEDPRALPPTAQDVFDRRRLHHAADFCFQASTAFPADPMPWISLLTLARLYGGGHPHTWHWWHELRARDPYSREGHHQLLRHLSARWHGSHGLMYNFARDTAAWAPLGSPLPVLAQAARAEHYRQLIRTQGRTSLGLSYHWTHDALTPDLNITLERWIAHRTIERAQDVPDLNLLAHALIHANRTHDAAFVFRMLGNRPTTTPWSYTGDPQNQFIQWHNQLNRSGFGRDSIV